MVTMYGAKGQEWITNLPSTIETYTKKWCLSDLRPIDELSMNYVVSAVCSYGKVVLKIGYEKDCIAREIRALQAFDGYSCIRLITHDKDQGVMLVQCATPGHSLKTFFPDRDKEATMIAAAIIKQLQSHSVVTTESFPTLDNWFLLLNRPWKILGPHLNKARQLRDLLLSTVEATVLLHGDLHHSNIIADGADWLAIDPKGVMGDPTYEVNCFIRNPLPEIVSCKDIKKIIKNRLYDFSQLLGFDQQRMLAWSYVQSVVSACWFIENNSNPAVSIELANILEHIDHDLGFNMIK